MKKHVPSPNDWVAPEHASAIRIMPRDLNRELIVDKRPSCMLPTQKKKSEIWYDVRASYNARLREDRWYYHNWS